MIEYLLIGLPDRENVFLIFENIFSGIIHPHRMINQAAIVW